MIGQISLYLPKYLASKIPHLVRYLNWLNQLSSSNSNIQVMILEKSGDGWWRGQYGNKVAFHLLSNLEVILKSGQFPGRVVSIQLHTRGDWRPAHLLYGWERPRRHGETLPFQLTAVVCNYHSLVDWNEPIIVLLQVALYAFKAQADTELSFSKGDRLEVTKNIFTQLFLDWTIVGLNLVKTNIPILITITDSL